MKVMSEAAFRLHKLSCMTQCVHDAVASYQKILDLGYPEFITAAQVELSKNTYQIRLGYIASQSYKHYLESCKRKLIKDLKALVELRNEQQR